MVPLVNGFEEIEAFTIVDVLRRAGIEVEMVGIPGTTITGAHGIRVQVDKRISEVKEEEYDGIILPGGSPGYQNLMKSSRILDIVRKLNAQGKLIGAICGAPLVLAKAGVLETKRATVYPGLEKQLPYPRDERVVIDGNVITSQGPATAMEFALKIVEKLLGKSKASEVAEALLFTENL